MMQMVGPNCTNSRTMAEKVPFSLCLQPRWVTLAVPGGGLLSTSKTLSAPEFPPHVGEIFIFRRLFHVCETFAFRLLFL